MLNNTNATEVIFHYMKCIRVHNATPLTEVLASRTDAAGNKQKYTIKIYLHIKRS
jgi:hypothetical protein